MLQPLATTNSTGRTAWPPVVPPPYPIIMLITGGYLVDLGPRRAPRFHLVLKNRTCNCGATQCRGKQAVKTYLNAGGPPAPDGSTLKHTLMGPCPICNEPTRDRDSRWECLRDSTHYFQYRVTRLRAAREKWLQSLPPEVAAWQKEVSAAFASPAARAAFLQQHALSYAAGA